MPRVMVKGFGEVDLPDGMSQEQMRLALRQMYPTSARQSATDALTPIQTADTYEPTLSEMISSGIGETLYDTGIVSDRYRAMDTGRTLGTATEMLPVVGDMIGGDDFGRAIAQDDMVGTGIGALSTIPVVGKPLGKGIKYAKGKLDFDPLDPNSQDLSQTKLFHGTSDVIDKPDINKTQAQDAGFMGQGFYMTGQPPVAQHYAEKSARATGGNPNIHPMTTKADASLVISPEEAAELKRFIASNPDSSSIVSEKLKQGGYDSIAIKSGDDVVEMNVFDPDMVESKFSASLFDELGDDALYKFSNINPEYIDTIDELGGLPSPSIGIAKVGDPISNFGEIGLIGRMDSFDSDPTFAADVYSPRQPKPDIDLSEDSVLGEQARLRQEQPEIAQAYGIPRFDRSSDPVDAARGEPSIIAEFAQSKGIDVSPQAQTTVTSNFEKMESLFGSSLELDEGITDSLSNQAKKYFASNLPPKPPENASKIRKKKYNDKLELYKAFFDDGQLNDLGYEVLKNEYDVNKAKSVFDKNTAARNLKDQFREQGLEGEFEQFIQDKVKSMNPQKSLFDSDYFYNTGERRSLEYNMDNILKAMNKQDVRGGEGFGGVGGTRALVTPRLKTIKDIKDNRGRIITGGEFNDITSDMDNLTADLQDYLIKESPELEDVFDGYNTFHEEIAEYIKGNPSAFDNISGESKGAVDLYLKDLEDMPTEYFEAKPRRAVELSEFYGAVVPKGTSRKVTAPLENAGLKIEYYDPEKGRTGAIKNLHKSSGGQIMFSAGGIAFLTTGDDEQETEL